MANISMKSLLEAGVHFGHQKRKWNPKMAKYIFGERNNVHIIDLQKTVRELKKAYKYIKDEVTLGKNILFVGTKRQAQESIKEEAERCSMFYINYRWLGGTLTNFLTIRKSIERLKKLEEMKASPVWGKLSKKELSRLDKELFKLKRALDGIKNMDSLPDLMFVIDPEYEKTAVLEGRKLGIPIVSVVDTDCDPDMIDVLVPGNDDAIRAIKLFAKIFADAVLEGMQIRQKQAIIKEQELEKEKEEIVTPIEEPDTKEESVTEKEDIS
ncbi:30S ribosomal protein S2 [bacterium]